MATTAFAVAGPSGVPDEHDTEPKSTLTPPATSGESSKADEDDSSSELSDLDMDDEEVPHIPTKEDHEVPQKSVEDLHVEGDVPEKNLDPIEPTFYYEGGKIPVFQPVSPLPVASNRPWITTPVLNLVNRQIMRNLLTYVLPHRPWRNSGALKTSFTESTTMG
jgi:hypothetical protein